MQRVKMFCCGCTLKTGAITAVVLTGISVLAYIIIGALLVNDAYKIQDVKHRNDASRDFINNNYVPHVYYYIKYNEHWRQSEELSEALIAIYKVLASYCFINAIYLLVIGIFLFFGIRQEKAIFVLVWLITEIIKIVFSSIFAICCFCLAVPTPIVIGAFVVGINGFAVYLWIVLLSYYQELNERALAQPNNVKAVS